MKRARFDAPQRVLIGLDPAVDLMTSCWAVNLSRAWTPLNRWTNSSARPLTRDVFGVRMDADEGSELGTVLHQCAHNHFAHSALGNELRGLIPLPDHNDLTM